MYPFDDSMSFHGRITAPRTAVITPPALAEMRWGARLEKSLAGETTLAARFVDSVATDRPTIARTVMNGPPIRAISFTGSQMSSPKITGVAEVTATPMNENSTMVAGRPSAWPIA